ncbi:bifunctional phosphoribosylaminoimidazolecarboxamide formyltransferase/IMP cyclohydrolase [Telmatocola sphagniphila]|uniref:Bifunctional purine biosynthesis protein PurH n=1 Tax=Telmatocola sphagniphila TaxID=1123043 RepID=A0A8E6B3X3_9BACT|nr:bifunctional phosphoribosylaminoimidazolecarboxamide formyltransferase/IMP cyclohydrolase [Telmatocola sphagniphila]QVL31422.1 bifunctional phosphoribosylaminoimidazolecarboxamide formyltransferase/IMP cyclohydrolase [Telmatocola sphagniphila]
MRIRIRRALLSVSDKSGLIDLAKVLAGFGVELISTGGTRKALAEAGLAVKDISEVTGFPEMLDGRVKTLHPIVYAGLLARRDLPEHMKTIADHQIQPIDMVVVNLYPFASTLAKPNATTEECIENIDIGGPTMLRAACKNFESVAVIPDPELYPKIIEELKANDGALELETRQSLAAITFERTARYDAAIADYFHRNFQKPSEEPIPALMAPFYKLKSTLRYGENPHQPAAVYIAPGIKHACVVQGQQLHGKELSYNNVLDADSALNLVREFSEPAAVVIKHNNPCGAAIASQLTEAFANAYDGDPQSAFGGIIAFNRVVDKQTAEIMATGQRFLECIVAPGFDDEAFQILTTKPTWKKNVRLLAVCDLMAHRPDPKVDFDFRRVDGGLLVQAQDRDADDLATWVPQTKRRGSDAELKELWFAWRVCKHVKSNAIVLAKNGMVIGVGAGQMSRVDSVQISIRKAGDRVRGSVLASDAFFPFRDNVDAAAAAGVRAIVQPGGSTRDQESIDACNEHDLAMLFTGIRHFRH